ncbi:MAG: hypothetical protein K1W04_05795 [Oscillospiraceae bacterium]
MLSWRPVAQTDRQRLWNLFQKYLYEMTNYYDDELDGEGNYRYGYFDRYFEEPDREALFLWDGDTLVGFAMLNRHSCLGETVDHALAEFTIFPMYRRQHLGLEAARMLFAGRPGRWELKYSGENTAAKALWTKATRPYDPKASQYQETETVLSFTV